MLSHLTPGIKHQFGQSVALAGETLAIGAPEGGWAYVFFRNVNVWSQQALLRGGNTTVNPTTNSDNFGYSVAVSGNSLVVGLTAKRVAALQNRPA